MSCCIAFYPDHYNDDWIVTSLDNKICIIDWRLGILVKTFEEHTDIIYAYDIMPKS